MRSIQCFKDNIMTNKDKKSALEVLLRETARVPFKTQYYKEILKEYDISELENMLGEDGAFCDLEDGIKAISPALKRLANIAETYHWYIGKTWEDVELKRRFLRAAARYCKMEADRKETGKERFHESIFRIPANAINLFYALLPDMLSVEDGNEDEELCEVYRQICRVGMQPWTLPLRHDSTDEQPISIERFRDHVWWVSANGVDYRPLVYSTIMYRNVEMMDVLVEVCIGALSPVSAAVEDSSFWKEGFCADGFGWGHGRQAYNTGYPAHGLRGILTILALVRGTPWEKELDRMNVDLIMHFIRSMTWGEFKGYSAPMQTRNIFLRDRNAFKEQEFKEIKSKENNWALFLTELFLEKFEDRLTEEYRKELRCYLEQKESLKVFEFEPFYQGMRYFWNNDTLIKKTDDMYFYVNMASSRCDGVEFADYMADKRNYFTADGSYVLMQTGTEYRDVMGTWQVSDLPGITSRKVNNQELKTETNWHGYRSKHNFAAGVARGVHGAAGFIFEKDDSREPDGAGVIYDNFSKEIMGVQAYKSYFVIGDTVMCLGTGITDMTPECGRDIHTTINNTAWESDICVLDHCGNVQECIAGDQEFCVDQEPLYIRQADVLYGILPKTSQKVAVCGEKRWTHWYDLNAGNREVEDTQVPVFELAIYHGQQPVNESYTYFMYCGKINVQEYLQNGQIKVLQNNKKLQAVSSADETVIQAVFYDPETVLKAGDWNIKMSAPGAVMLEKDEQNQEIFVTICDGEQDPSRSAMTVFIKKRSLEWTEVHIQLPKRPQCGAPVTVRVSTCQTHCC